MAEHLRKVCLGVVHTAQIDRIPPGDMLTHELARRRQAVDACQRAVLIKHHIVVRQQRAHSMRQLFYRDEGVAVVQVEGKRIGHARVRTLVRQQ